MIIKLTESIKGNPENIANAQKFIAEFANKAKSAFDGAGVDCEFEWGTPSVEPRNNRDNEPFVDDIYIDITIGSVIFRFYAEIFNTFGRAFYSEPVVKFSHSGSTTSGEEFTVANAEKLLSVTKIAESLSAQFKSEYAELLKTL